MKALLIALLSTVTLSATAAVTCTGAIDIYSDSNPLHKKSDLLLTFNHDNFIKADTQIDEAYYSINADLESKSITLTISFGPEYTSGLLTKGWFNQSGEFKMTRVERDRVYTLLCKR